MSFLVTIDTAAPTPKMVQPAADAFARLRKIVLDGCGHDFLAKCGDVFRPADFISSKSGVANRSWHKTGRAFDYDQESPFLVIVSEPSGGKQFFRTYLRCAVGLGKTMTVHDYRGYNVSAYLFDFTSAAEAIGWHRIPAWAGWQHVYNYRELWHYQFDQGLTWAAAIAQIANDGKHADVDLETVSLNDRDSNTGGLVTKIQTAVSLAGFLPAKAIDGIFGAQTRNAVIAFQRLKGLTPDGIVGPKTMAAMELV